MLLFTDKRLLDYATDCPHVKMIKWMLDCKYLQHNEGFAASMIPILACNGQLNLAQCILQLYSLFQEDHKDWISTWVDAIQKVCKCGTVDVLQWLIDSPTGREACDCMKNYQKSYCLLPLAAEHGNVAAMKYIHEQRLADEFDQAMMKAVRNGDLSSIKWMLEHHTNDVSKSVVLLIDISAEYGHLETLKFFHDLDGGRVQTDSWWFLAVDPIYFAAKGGQLAVIEWIHANRSQNCEADAMDIAAGNGRLEVVKWLHSKGSEGCTSMAMTGAAMSGHLDVVQWLHANYPNIHRSTRVMYNAAEYGHLKVIKWLYENIPETRTTYHATERAIRSDHIRVADWLQSRFPDFVVGTRLDPHKSLVTVNTTELKNTFETLLFLHVRCAYVFTSSFLLRLRKKLANWEGDPPINHITNYTIEGVLGQPSTKLRR